MIDNSQDKGYLTIQLEEKDDGFHLREQSILDRPNVFNFYVDYENSTIFIDYGDGDPRKIIGHYDQEANECGMVRVYDETKTRVIGQVGEELIYFVSKDADPSVNRYLPERECLAFYSAAGSITKTNISLERVGLINGSQIGGAAAFVAVFHGYIFHSMFREFFEMEYDAFKAKYASYLD